MPRTVFHPCGVRSDVPHDLPASAAQRERCGPSWRQWKRGTASLAAVLTISSGSTAAVAGQIELSLEQSLTGQSNVFRSATDSTEDGLYEIKPIVRIHDEAPRYGYSLEYRPSYEAYFESNGVDGFDHFFRGNIYFDPEPISTVRFNADVTNYRSVRALANGGGDGIPDVVPETTGRITRAFLDLDYERDLTRATTATLGMRFQSYDYSTPNNPDSIGFSADTALVHQLTRDFALGGSLLGSYREFDELAPQPASQNTVVNANLTAFYEPIPSLFLELSIGPAAVFTRQDDPSSQLVNRFIGTDTPLGVPVAGVYQTNQALPTSCQSVGGQFILESCPLRFVPGFTGSFDEQVSAVFDRGAGSGVGDEDKLTVFVDAEIRWEDSWGTALAHYTRTEDASAGIGSTTIRDSITGVITFVPCWKIDVRIRGNWNERKATGATNTFATRAGPSTFTAPGGLFVAEATGLIYTGVDTETNITQYWADLQASREVYEDVWLELGFLYLNQGRIDDPGSTQSDFENYIGSLTVRYEFTPIEF